MENNNIKKRKFGRKTKIIAASVAVLLLAGASVYAVNAAGSISEVEAKQIALAQVSGADQSHITKFARDMDNGREEYDVEIVYGGYEYNFEISAKDGKIYDQSKERAEADDRIASPSSDTAASPSSDAQQPVVVSPTPPSNAADSASGDIGLEQAKSVALGQVSGASYENITAAYSDYDDGRLEYDVEIRYDGYEYDFEIDGTTGKVLGKDVDRIEYDDYYDYD